MGNDPIRVLLVDDDRGDYLIVRQLLARIESRVVTLEWADSYDRAVAAIERQEHDVYLVDYRLGERDGLELLRETVARGCTAPVILLTGMGEGELDLAAIKEGAADYLEKGQISTALLERSIRLAIERKRAEQALQKAKDELETRVKERTSELTRANEALQKEIAERKQALEQLAETDRRKDEFLAMLAHELRNPLNVISNAAHLMRMRAGEIPALQRPQELVERQARHMTRLIDEMMDVSRITRGKIELSRSQLDLGRLVRDTLEDYRVELEGKGLRLELTLPPHPVMMEGDPTRLHQIVGNLLQNSGKFTAPGGQVRVELSVDPEERKAAVTVQDTGMGISPAMLPLVFEPFAQGDRSLDRSQGGLGLGLAVVRGLTRLHGGEVQAASEGEGRGARFTVLLPLMALFHTGEPPPLAPEITQPVPLKILIIEDNRDAADTLQEILSAEGHQVALAYSGSEGIDLARKFQPEVVLCDIGIPQMSGYEVAVALKQDARTAGARLVAVSGYGQEEDRRRSQTAGFVAHLIKPVNLLDLQRLLHHTSESRLR